MVLTLGRVVNLGLIKIKMGSRQSAPKARPISQASYLASPGHWSQTFRVDNYVVITNDKTNQMAEVYLVHIKDSKVIQQELEMYEYRKTGINNLVAVYGVDKVNSGNLCSGSATYKVVTERIPKRLSEMQLTLAEGIYVLRECLDGFQFVHESIEGAIKITGGMIGFNQEGKVKIWVNQNFGANRPLKESYIKIGKYEASHSIMPLQLVELIGSRMPTGGFPAQFKSRLKPQMCPDMDFGKMKVLVRNFRIQQNILPLESVDMVAQSSPGIGPVNPPGAVNTQRLDAVEVRDIAIGGQPSQAVIDYDSALLQEDKVGSLPNATNWELQMPIPHLSHNIDHTTNLAYKVEFPFASSTHNPQLQELQAQSPRYRLLPVPSQDLSDKTEKPQNTVQKSYPIPPSTYATQSPTGRNLANEVFNSPFPNGKLSQFPQWSAPGRLPVTQTKKFNHSLSTSKLPVYQPNNLYNTMKPGVYYQQPKFQTPNYTHTTASPSSYSYNKVPEHNFPVASLPARNMEMEFSPLKSYKYEYPTAPSQNKVRNPDWRIHDKQRYRHGNESNKCLGNDQLFERIDALTRTIKQQIEEVSQGLKSGHQQMGLRDYKTSPHK